MKNFSFITLSIAATLSAQTSVADTLKIKVDGMVCGFCASSIEKKMRANKATADVYVSLENKIVAVSEKTGQKLDDAALKAQIADAGYEVKLIERVTTSIADVRAATKAKKT
jgi:copper chaperone CopZ